MKKRLRLLLPLLSLLLSLLVACGSTGTSRNLHASAKPQIPLKFHASGARCPGNLPAVIMYPENELAANTPLGVNPVAVSWGAGRSDVFYVDGNDLHLHHLWSDQSHQASDTIIGVGYGNESWGGNWRRTQFLAATTWGAGRLDVFLVGQDHQLYHYWQDGGPAYGLEPLGGNFDPSETPAAVSWVQGRLDVFLVDPGTHQLEHYWQNNGGPGWDHAWLDGGPFEDQTPPSVISTGPGSLDVFAVATDHRLYDFQSVNDGAFIPIPMGGPSYTTNAYPASVHWGNRRADVFVVDPTGALFHYWSDENQPFGYERVSGSYASTLRPSAISWGVGRLDVFLDNQWNATTHVWQDSSLTGITWNTPGWLGCPGFDFLSALTWGDGSIDVFADYPPSEACSFCYPGLWHYYG